jgi:hypothetical protein
MVAIPVQESDSTPSPKYSMMAPVPPLTVRIPATFRMTSVREREEKECQQPLSPAAGLFTTPTKLTLGSGPSRDLSSELDSNGLGALELPRKVGDDIDGVSSSDSNGDHAESSSVGSVRVGSNHESSGESVVLDDDL